MDPFVDQLKGLCAAYPTRSKWVFAPTHAIGRTLGDRLVLEGTDWANLRFVTPLDIALLMAAPFLVERGIDPSEEELGPALMMRLLLDLPLEGGYFRPLANHPTLAQALWVTVRELRMTGVCADTLTRHGFASPAKHAEIVALLLAYESFLNEHKRADMAAVYQEAVRHPDWCPIQPEDCCTELPDANWNPLQRALLDRMPGEWHTPRTFELPGVLLPRRLSSRRAERLKAGAATNPLAFLMAPAATAADHLPRPKVQLFHAGGREAEIEEVFRRILAGGVTLDQVEIACSSDAHLALVWEKALRMTWPVTLGAGIPAAFTRPGRALLGLCDWIETNFSAGHLRQLLQSGDISAQAHEEFTAGQAARVLARAEAGWGRASYGLALGRLCKSYESRAADPEQSDTDRALAKERAERAARVRTWITDLVAFRACCRRPGQGSSADGRERRTGLPRAQDRTQQCARSSGGGRAAGTHRRASRAGHVLVRVARGAAVRPGTCPVAHGRARASPPGSSLRLAIVASGLCRPPAPLHRWARGRSGVLLDHGRRGAARRRTSRDLGRPSPVDGSHRRSGVCGVESAGLERCGGDVQLLEPRYARVPGNLRVLADAAGVSAPAGQPDPGLCGDEVCAGRAEIGGAWRP